MKYLLVGDIHENYKLLDNAIKKQNDEQIDKIIFLGDMFHVHKTNNSNQQIDNNNNLGSKFISLVKNNKAIWICGNHDYIQFLISYAIINCKCNTLNKHCINHKRKYKKDNGYYIRHGIEYYKSHKNEQHEFVDFVLSGGIKFCEQLTNDMICSHSCIFSDNTIKTENDFNTHLYNDLDIIDKNKELFDFSFSASKIWCHIEKILSSNNNYNKNDIKSLTNSTYTLNFNKHLIYKYNFIGHTPLKKIFNSLLNVKKYDKDISDNINNTIINNFDTYNIFNINDVTNNNKTFNTDISNKYIYDLDTTILIANNLFKVIEIK